MALQFDEALHRGMRAWPNQRLAAEHLGWFSETFAHVPEPTPKEEATWFARKAREDDISALGWSKEQVSQKWCEILAAPLALRQALLEEG